MTMYEKLIDCDVFILTHNGRKYNGIVLSFSDSIFKIREFKNDCIIYVRADSIEVIEVLRCKE